MPNYCHNRLVIEGPDEEVAKLVAAVADPRSEDADDRFAFARISPVDEGEDEAEAWGSTSLYCLKVVRTAGEVVYEFQSSWDPPCAVIRALAEQWPALTFELVYIEPLTARYGTLFFRDGGRQRWNEAGSGGFGDDDYEMRCFLDGEWPELAKKWWDDDDACEEEVA
jgi:hypothetical protein